MKMLSAKTKQVEFTGGEQTEANLTIQLEKTIESGGEGDQRLWRSKLREGSKTT